MNYNEIVQMREELKDAVFEYWINHTLFQWEWWVLLVLTIVPWVVFWMVVDKNRTHEILTFGFFIAILTVFVDDLGTFLVWWHYPHSLIGVSPPLVPVDLAITPCSMMIVYQYFRRWKAYLAVTLGLALFSSYIGETLFIMADFYALKSWRPFYSVIFYLAAGAVGKWFAEKTAPDK
jgi:hypothetical protein